MAEDTCGQFQAGLPWKTIGAKPQSNFHRSLAFLNDSRMPAVISEPTFKDNDIQRSWTASQARHHTACNAATLPGDLLRQAYLLHAAFLPTSFPSTLMAYR